MVIGKARAAQISMPGKYPLVIIGPGLKVAGAVTFANLITLVIIAGRNVIAGIGITRAHRQDGTDQIAPGIVDILGGFAGTVHGAGTIARFIITIAYRLIRPQLCHQLVIAVIFEAGHIAIAVATAADFSFPIY